jgi:DNA sulfur modification protein DndB
MAIVTRRLVENHRWFRDPKIVVIASQNMPVGNRTALTTIASLYDILKLLFMFAVGKRSERILRFNRPSDERLASFEALATDYFNVVGNAFKPVGALLKTKRPAKVTQHWRGPHGGHFLFRPIGLDIFTRTAINVATEKELDLLKAVERIKGIPTNLDSPPYRDVIWDPTRHTMIPGGKTLARALLRYMTGLKEDEEKLVRNYRIALRVDPDDASIKLPRKLR